MALRLKKYKRREIEEHLSNEAKGKIQQVPAFWNDLEDYLKKSDSRGCSYSDYWLLYDYITREKPKFILECGTGVSTIALANAVKHNHEQHGIEGHIISMEESEQWHQKACEFLPDHLKPYVEILQSPKIEDCFSIFRGVRYRDVPEKPYEFVFIDGPKPRAPSDNAATFCSDYLRVVLRSDFPVYAITDKRLPTLYVYQQIFGMDKVQYDASRMLGFIGPCSKSDVHDAENIPLPLPTGLVSRENHKLVLSPMQVAEKS